MPAGSSRTRVNPLSPLAAASSFSKNTSSAAAPSGSASFLASCWDRIAAAASVKSPSTVVIVPDCVPAGISKSSSGTLTEEVSDFTTCLSRQARSPLATLKVWTVPFSPKAPAKVISLFLWPQCGHSKEQTMSSRKCGILVRSMRVSP